MNEIDLKFMHMALDLALLGQKKADEVPVGALVVNSLGEIVAQAHNQKESLNCALWHSEIIALIEASKNLGRWRLDDCTLYVTLEPCSMCAGALVQSRVKRLVFGAKDPKAGACGSVYNIIQDARLNHQIEVRSGILSKPCGQALSDFFKAKRLNKLN